MRRRYPKQPIVAVAALILNDKNEVLLVRRKAEPGKDMWSIPGGVVELGEYLYDALKREIKEETGLDIKPMKLLDIFEILERDEDNKIKYHYVILDYLAEKCGGVLRASSDASQARWIALNEIYSYNITKSLKKLLDKHIHQLI